MTPFSSTRSIGAAPAGPERSPSESDLPLRAYTRLKLDLAAQIRLLREALRQRGDERRVARCAALMVKLATDRFTLAVLGQFKRGKSSLMNALVGREVLPVGVRPLTSAITVLRYGSTDRLLIQRKHWATQEEAPPARLADYVTEKGNPGNREQVEAAYLELASPFLRRGLEFVDTPGVGSSVAANTVTTYAFLPQCDAALFVTSAEAPLNRVELEFLRDIRRHATKLFFIINKIDLLEEAERSDIREFVRSTLQTEAGLASPGIFPVSATQGLAGKLRDDPALLARSGLPELESALADFLTRQGAATLLESVLRQAEQLLHGAQVEAAVAGRTRLAAADTRLEGEQRLAAAFQRLDDEREKMLQRAHQAFSREVHARVTEAIGSFLHDREGAMARHLGRALQRGRFLSGRKLARRFAGSTGRLIERAAAREFWPDLERNGASLAAIPEAARRALAANLNGIQEAAADLHGVAPSDEEPADLLVPMGNPFAHLPRPPRSEWQPVLSRALLWPPAGWIRRGLRQRLAADFRSWLARWSAEVRSTVAQAAEDAFARWAEEVGSAAKSLEARFRRPSDEREFPGQTDILAAIAGHFSRMRREVAQVSEGSPGPGPGLAEDEPSPAGFRDGPSAADHTASAEDMAAQLKTRGCPVCAHLVRTNSDFLAGWQHELFSSEAAQRRFAAELGFCARHQWQLEAISSPVGISAGQAPLVRRVSGLLGRAARQPSERLFLAGLLSRRPPCRVCRLEETAEKAYVARLGLLLGTDAGREAYAASQGLCLPHLGALLSILPDDETARFVLACASRKWSELSEEMESFAMKTEALRRQLRNRDEEDAFWRATILLRGSRSLCQPWPPED